MRKGIVLAGLVTVLSIAAPTHAKAEQLGVYVTPKLVYGATIMNNTKAYEKWDNGAGSTGTLVNKISNGSDSVYGGSLAIGYDFNKRFNLPVRAEVEYSIFSEAKNKGSQSDRFVNQGHSNKESYFFEQRFGIQTLFVNAYYDFHTGTAFTPYIGGGLGMAFIDTKGKGGDSYNSSWDGGSYSESVSSTGSTTRSNFAWNIGAGIAYAFTENFALDLGYRFAGLGSVKTKTHSFEDEGGDTISIHGKTQDIYMHQVFLGLRFSF